jgi:hypothetical protein
MSDDSFFSLLVLTYIGFLKFSPFPKFLCVKAVIFFSFWQGVVISILVYMGVIKGGKSKILAKKTAAFYVLMKASVFVVPFVDVSTTENISKALQDFLICFEMMIAAWFHAKAFSPDDYATGARVMTRFAMRDALGIRDIVEDMKHTWRGTRFAAMSAAESLLEQLSEQRRGQITRVLERLGYRRRFASRSGRVVTTQGPGYFNVDGDERVRGDFFLQDTDSISIASDPLLTEIPEHALQDPVAEDIKPVLEGNPQSDALSSEIDHVKVSPANSPSLVEERDHHGPLDEQSDALISDPTDEALYRFAKSFLPTGDYHYPVVPEYISPQRQAHYQQRSNPSYLRGGTAIPPRLPTSSPPSPNNHAIQSPTRIGKHPYRSLESNSPDPVLISISPTDGNPAVHSVLPTNIRRVAEPGPPPMEFNPL